jgi:hypothetical protein
MKRIRQITVFGLAALTTLIFANSASAGEPFHPFWDPIFDFFYFWF